MAFVNRHLGYVFCLAALPIVMTAGCSAAPGEEGAADSDDAALNAIPEVSHKALCADAPGKMRCFARALVDEGGAVKSFAAPSGLGPADLKAAYKLPAVQSTATIGIVDAMDNPKAESDLAKYRASSGSRPARPRTAASRRSTRTASRHRFRPRTTGGRVRSRSTSIWRARFVRPARSSWSRRAPRRSTIWARPSTWRCSSAPQS
jgi:hypothetical protein